MLRNAKKGKYPTGLTPAPDPSTTAGSAALALALALVFDVSAGALAVVGTGFGVLAVRLNDGDDVAVIPDGDDDNVEASPLWNAAAEVPALERVGVAEEAGASLSWVSSVPALSVLSDGLLCPLSRAPRFSPALGETMHERSLQSHLRRIEQGSTYPLSPRRIPPYRHCALSSAELPFVTSSRLIA